MAIRYLRRGQTSWGRTRRKRQRCRRCIAGYFKNYENETSTGKP
ncbi:MAG: hypothetical protein ACLU8D_14380 [Enterocloster sp.]